MTSTKNVIGLTVQVAGAAIIVINFFRALTSVDLVGGALAFDIFMQGLVFGILLLGFGEIINLLQGLFNQREPKDALVHQELPRADSDNPDVKPQQSSVTADMKRQITELYAKKNLEVESIEPTLYEGIVYVNVQGKQNIVDLNGFHPQILTQKEINKLPTLKSGLEADLFK